MLNLFLLFMAHMLKKSTDCHGLMGEPSGPLNFNSLVEVSIALVLENNEAAKTKRMWSFTNTQKCNIVVDDLGLSKQLKDALLSNDKENIDPSVDSENAKVRHSL